MTRSINGINGNLLAKVAAQMRSSRPHLFSPIRREAMILRPSASFSIYREFSWITKHHRETGRSASHLIQKSTFATGHPLWQQQQQQHDTLSTHEYGKVSEKTMQALYDGLSELEDQFSSARQLHGFDCEYSNGVLTLKLGTHGTFVLNKQPPNKQIWLSSPLSGPKRYDWNAETKQWIYRRDGSTLFELLETELGQLFQEKVQLQRP